MDKRYQIFVSSTFRDLVDERQDVIKSIIDLGHIPAGMEGFPAIDMEQLKYIKKVIDQCDYYILIVAGRYGSIHTDGISFTEKEYQYAVESGKMVLAFVLENPETLHLDKVDMDADVRARLDVFRTHAMTGRVARLWKDRDSLKYAVITSLVAAFEEQPGIGWIRANTAASTDILSQINDLRIRNEELQNHVSALKKELTPKLDALASLDSPFSVNYKHSKFYGGKTQHYQKSLEITWRAIFTAVGPQLMQGHLPGMISRALDNYMSEKNLVGDDRYPHILDTTEHQIKIQLSALGLIKIYTANKVGGGVAEFVQITDYGKRVLYETMAIRE